MPLLLLTIALYVGYGKMVADNWSVDMVLLMEV